MGQDRRPGEAGDAGFERREELVHRVTDANGPGSPGGLAKPGRAEGLGGWDPGMRLRPRGGDEAPRRGGASRAVPAGERRAGEPEEGA